MENKVARIYGDKVWKGARVSDYGWKHGYIDYRCLARTFNCVLSNDIIRATTDAGIYDWEEVNGSEYNPETDEYFDVYQYFIIDANGAETLQYFTDEIVWYSETLDMYVWGVCHCGTGWDYVLTNIKIDKGGRE